MKNYETKNAYEAAKMAYAYLQDEHHETGRVFLFSDSVAVCTGSVPSSDLEYCKENGIMVFPAMHLGGSIVCFPGDLSIMEICWGKSAFATEVIQSFVGYLKELGLQAEQEKNDVLVDGKKIASWARATNIEGWTQSVVHFSVGMDLEVVKKICTKPMVKVPGRLADYGITSDMIANRLERDGII